MLKYLPKSVLIEELFLSVAPNSHPIFILWKLAKIC